MNLDELLARKIESGREYRRFDASGLQTRSEDSNDDGAMIVEGYATVFNVPYELFSMDGYTVSEQVDSKAFEGCDMDDVIMQYDHIGRVFARISNKTLTVDPDAHGLKIRADLSGTELGRQLYQEIRDGYTTKMSFGFVVDKDERKVEEDHETGTVSVLRTITKIRKLYDVSAVSLPANDTTEISARNLSEGVIKEVAEECRKRARSILSLRLKLMEV